MKVVVVGAGIVGAATAYELRRRGVETTLVDRGEVSGGTTGLGEGNVLCSDKDAGPELDLTIAGLAMFDELEELLGEEARIRRKGALIVHPLEETWAAEPARAERLREAGVEAHLVDDVADLEPNLTGAIHGALHVPRDLQCDPRAIARGLAARSGARVLTHTEVTAADGGGVHLATGDRLDADAVVIAAGPWSRPLAEGAGVPLPLEPRKGQLVRLTLPEPDERFLRHKVVDGSYLLSLKSGGAERQVSTVVETIHDGHLVVGSSRERCGFDGTVDEALADEMQERAARLVPSVEGLRRDGVWVGFRPWLPDHLPAIGPTQVEGLWLATGHEGAGVALGPITGRLIARMVAGEEPGIDVAPFDPRRLHRDLEIQH